MNILDHVFTTAEASHLWGIHRDTLKKCCIGQKGLPPRFMADECKKSAGVWLVTRQGMERLYGKLEK
ncbi:helix-turn-helix domain-containing protein [Veillonella montpellierensis]|uniref:helix-turn-helix domain-containing protein n=1 Tax=Veillonella montpellierensis TaxID=187328 RepID=UPI0023F6A0BF|nr:helix-turn-helix domain-containing protein [Veillonella montpellierensis]